MSPGTFELTLPSGKAGFGQLAWPLASALRRAYEMLLDSGGSPESNGVSEFVEGWLIEVQRPRKTCESPKVPYY